MSTTVLDRCCHVLHHGLSIQNSAANQNGDGKQANKSKFDLAARNLRSWKRQALSTTQSTHSPAPSTCALEMPTRGMAARDWSFLGCFSSHGVFEIGRLLASGKGSKCGAVPRGVLPLPCVNLAGGRERLLQP
ncbi:hypothetical protein MUK42_23481 [Musa troglodytarum]|uniref:Uncharacterized protein n=1 Tax=Musa troglodytarum TaxID=320322 RepID=A0A9E7JHM7_9LILI|nr:hypothetical protein MUK42_23481 [Musa troglodytarum]